MLHVGRYYLRNSLASYYMMTGQSLKAKDVLENTRTEIEGFLSRGGSETPGLATIYIHTIYHLGRVYFDLGIFPHKKTAFEALKLSVEIRQKLDQKVVNDLTIEEIKVLVDNLSTEQLKVLVSNITPMDLKQWIDSATSEELQKVISGLVEKEMQMLIGGLTEEILKEVINGLTPEKLQKVINDLAPEVLKELLGCMTPGELKELVSSMVFQDLKEWIKSATPEKLKTFANSLSLRELKRWVDGLPHENLQNVISYLAPTKLNDWLPEELKPLVGNWSQKGLEEWVNGLHTEKLQKLIRDLPPDKQRKLIGSSALKEAVELLKAKELPYNEHGLDSVLVRRNGMYEYRRRTENGLKELLELAEDYEKVREEPRCKTDGKKCQSSCDAEKLRTFEKIVTLYGDKMDKGDKNRDEFKRLGEETIKKVDEMIKKSEKDSRLPKYCNDAGRYALLCAQKIEPEKKDTRLQEAEKYFTLAIEQSSIEDLHTSEAWFYLGEIAMEKEHVHQARYYLHKAQKIQQQIGILPHHELREKTAYAVAVIEERERDKDYKDYGRFFA